MRIRNAINSLAGIIPTRRFRATWSMRQRLTVLLVILAIVPALVLTTFSFTIASNTIQRRAASYSSDIVFQTLINLEDRIEKISDISFNVANDQDVQRTLLESETSTSSVEYYQEERRAREVLASQILFDDEIQSAFVRSNGGKMFKLDKAKSISSSRISDAMAQIPDSGEVVWKPGGPDDTDIVLGRAINSITTQERLGTLAMTVPESFIAELMESTRHVLGGHVMVVDEDSLVVSSSDTELIGTRLAGLDEQLSATDAEFGTHKIDGVDTFVSTSAPIDNGWRVVAQIPSDDYLQEVRDLRAAILVGGIVMLVGISLLVGLVAKSFTRPINELVADIRQFGRGKLYMRSTIERSDEIGLMADEFNRMAENIDDLVKRVQKEQDVKRQLEVRSLRMQINPHFLYNTLDSINWSARKEGADDAGDMAESLGALFRASIGAQDMSSMAEEIVRLEHYLLIQNYRYGDRLTINFEIEEASKELAIPTLLLQPLVENALLHGIGLGVGAGTITIGATHDPQTLRIWISDDGVGIDRDELTKIQDQIKNETNWANSIKTAGDSIGILNVSQRLRALFGSRSTVEMESEMGEGTTITLLLPATQMDEEHDERNY